MLDCACSREQQSNLNVSWKQMLKVAIPNSDVHPSPRSSNFETVYNNPIHRSGTELFSQSKFETLSCQQLIWLKSTVDLGTTVIEKDLQEQNLGLWTAWFYAQDRVRWRKVVETATLQ